MKKCIFCGKEVESGLVVHVGCVNDNAKHLLAEVERRLLALPRDVPEGRWSDSKGYKMGLAMAMNVVKDMQAGR